MRGGESPLPKHGGYKNTRTWQLADLIYDVTVRFCDKYVNPRSRTHDQMVQAARSGCQNLQEGSVDSATSKKIELWKPKRLPLKKKGALRSVCTACAKPKGNTKEKEINPCDSFF
ncbi:MAG: hypothetical protein K9J81_01260 [Desulfohalobiaceae bacterium]|nr:hypothetical protein [Desulfohalobiaceae bacterium]